MLFVDEILISIFSYCDRSCLYPLILTSKHIKNLVIDIVPSPNVLVVFKIFVEDFLIGKVFRFMNWVDYSEYKQSHLYINNHAYGFLKCGRNVDIEINMERIIDRRVINDISRIDFKILNSFDENCIITICLKYEDYIFDFDEPRRNIITLKDILNSDDEEFIKKNIRKIPCNILSPGMERSIGGNVKCFRILIKNGFSTYDM